MRTHLALAATLLAVAAAPARAQGGAPPFHGNGFDIVLPPGYPPMVTQHTSEEGRDMEVFISSKGENSALIVFHTGMEDVGMNDTTLATRRALLQLARSGMDGAQGDMRITGEPEEVTRDDRVAIRMPVKMDVQGQPATGWAEVSIPRRGPVGMWMVMMASVTPGAADRKAVTEVMDSFRLTGDGPTSALAPPPTTENAR
jgi:hypothetical protein